MKTLSYALTVATALGVSAANATNIPDDDQGLLNTCDTLAAKPGQHTANPCGQYIRGYIEGARIVDELFVDHLKQDHKNFSSFVERAHKTRGRQTSRENPVDLLSLAPFCLPNNEESNLVMTAFLGQLSTPLDSTNELNQGIDSFLKGEYPCDKRGLQ